MQAIDYVNGAEVFIQYSWTGIFNCYKSFKIRRRLSMNYGFWCVRVEESQIASTVYLEPNILFFSRGKKKAATQDSLGVVSILGRGLVVDGLKSFAGCKVGSWNWSSWLRILEVLEGHLRLVNQPGPAHTCLDQQPQYHQLLSRRPRSSPSWPLETQVTPTDSMGPSEQILRMAKNIPPPKKNHNNLFLSELSPPLQGGCFRETQVNQNGGWEEADRWEPDRVINQFWKKVGGLGRKKMLFSPTRAAFGTSHIKLITDNAPGSL